MDYIKEQEKAFEEWFNKQEYCQAELIQKRLLEAMQDGYDGFAIAIDKEEDEECKRWKSKSMFIDRIKKEVPELKVYKKTDKRRNLITGKVFEEHSLIISYHKLDELSSDYIE